MPPDHELEETRPTGVGRARGLVSNRRSGSRVEARSYAPPDDLADIIETLWLGRWDLRGQPPHTTELLGDPCVHLVFEKPSEDRGGRVVGVWTSLWTRTLAEQGCVYGIKLHPGASRAVLADPAHTYSNRRLPLHQPELYTAVHDADDEAAAVHILVEWVRSHRRDDDWVSLAVALVKHARTSGLTRVDALAEEGGMTVRGLQRLFRSHVGASPKWVVRRFRLQEAATRVEAGAVQQLGDLAIELGYADQAHLARDFRAATGRTLSQFEASVHA